MEFMIFLQATSNLELEVLSWIDVLSIIGIVVSIVLAIVSVVLSFTFFRITSKIAKKTDDNLKQINSSVEKLEKFYDTFYKDTFDMLKDTQGDMRKYIFNRSEETSPTEGSKEEIKKK